MPDTHYKAFLHQPTQRVNLEDLLKLKRGEKPDAIFWEKFDRQFEQKRLKVLIKKELILIRWSKSIWKRINILIPSTAAIVLALVSFLNLQNHLAPKLLATLWDLPSPLSLHSVTDFKLANTSAVFVKNPISNTQGTSPHASKRLQCSSDVRYISGNIAYIATHFSKQPSTLF